jgi:hypothetical protein
MSEHNKGEFIRNNFKELIGLTSAVIGLIAALIRYMAS